MSSDQQAVTPVRAIVSHVTRLYTFMHLEKCGLKLVYLLKVFSGSRMLGF